MLKQIKTLGLALIVSMLVGCEDIESTEIQETENVKQEQQVEKEIKTKEDKNEEPKTETKESELSKSLKGKSRNTKIRTIITQALETTTAGVDWEEAYLKEYKETGIELSDFLNIVIDKSIVAMIESVDSIPELAELEPTEKEITEMVSTYFAAEFSTLNTKNLVYRKVQIDEAKKIEEWENSDWNKEAEEIVPIIEHEEARDIMEKYASEHFGCTVYVADISLEEELYSGIMYATSDYRLSLGYIHVNCISGELDEIIEDANAASKLEAVN